VDAGGRGESAVIQLVSFGVSMTCLWPELSFHGFVLSVGEMISTSSGISRGSKAVLARSELGRNSTGTTLLDRAAEVTISDDEDLDMEVSDAERGLPTIISEV